MSNHAPTSISQQRDDQEAIASYSKDHNHVDFHSSKMIATMVACTAAGLITYPAEMVRLSFTNNVLSTWDFERKKDHFMKTRKPVEVSGSSNYSLLLSTLNKRKQKLRIVVSPLVRLVSYESICVGTYQCFEKNSSDVELGKSNNVKKEVLAGAISGFCQAIIFCPLELHRANQLKKIEEKERNIKSVKYWMRWTKSQLLEGGVGDPHERWKRVYRGVGTLAAREMLFNLSFFPMFYGLKRYFDSKTHWNDGSNCSWYDNNRSREALNFVASGVLSGLLCSFAVTPMDVFKTYMLYSREYWSIWSGTNVIGPPFKLLFQGLAKQACLLGPTFGIVAAVYEFA
mmetsp:Transcript_23297/g.35301  ORF Transcript_23297/g.35301 Transcript_23297/m.35301 type:complete len:342 (+) Transcript_23297:83-1108(+)